MAEEATEEEVMVEVVDSGMGSSTAEVVDNIMVEVVDSIMAEVVDSNMDGNTNNSTLHLSRHIWLQQKRPSLVHHQDSQRKKEKMRQHLGTFLTMSTQMKVILTECLLPLIALIQIGS